MALESLKILEEKVVGVLARHEQVRMEKAALLARLEAREHECETLLSRVQQYEQERDEVKERLAKILDRLTGLDL